MPIYEFKCDDCTDDFEEFVRNAAAVNQVTCPTCGSEKVTKRLSTFASRAGGSLSSSSAASASSCSTGST